MVSDSFMRIFYVVHYITIIFLCLFIIPSVYSSKKSLEKELTALECQNIKNYAAYGMRVVLSHDCKLSDYLLALEKVMSEKLIENSEIKYKIIIDSSHMIFDEQDAFKANESGGYRYYIPGVIRSMLNRLTFEDGNKTSLEVHQEIAIQISYLLTKLLIKFNFYSNQNKANDLVSAVYSYISGLFLDCTPDIADLVNFPVAYMAREEQGGRGMSSHVVIDFSNDDENDYLRYLVTQLMESFMYIAKVNHWHSVQSAKAIIKSIPELSKSGTGLILEIGSGNGVLASLLRLQGLSVIATDKNNNNGLMSYLNKTNVEMLSDEEALYKYLEVKLLLKILHGLLVAQ